MHVYVITTTATATLYLHENKAERRCDIIHEHFIIMSEMGKKKRENKQKMSISPCFMLTKQNSVVLRLVLIRPHILRDGNTTSINWGYTHIVKLVNMHNC